MREISYAQAINEALAQMLERDERVFLIGQGVTSPWYVGRTTSGLAERFGTERVLDTPVSENAITGAAVGAAIAGMHPVVVHPRMDFMYYAMDPIANHAANWHFMFGGRVSVPVTFWSIINRGGEQAAQHSQNLTAMLAHIPGLKLVAPSNPYDAKGLLTAAIEDANPVVFLDDRWLYEETGDVPEEYYSLPLGSGIIRRDGTDVTVVASSYMVNVAIAAATDAATSGINVEVYDPRTLTPFDEETLFSSLHKTGRMLVLESGWKTGGFGAEITALAAEKGHALKAPPRRIGLPDTPAPASSILEAAYYPGVSEVTAALRKMVSADSLTD